MKTRITEYLDKNDVNYRVILHSKPIYTVDMAVVERNVPLDQVVKCILLRDKKGQYVMVCATGDVRIDLQAVRKYLPSQYKRMSFANPAAITDLTGFVKGSVPPLDLPSTLPLFFDEGIMQRPKVNISSGHPLAGIELSPQALQRLSNAVVVALTN